MTQKPINQTDFAKKLGIQRQALTYAIKKGMIVKHGTGRASYIDLECPKTKAYMKSSASQRFVGKGTKPPAIPKPTAPEKKAKAITPAPPVNAEAAEAFSNNQDKKALKIAEELEKLRIGNRKARGELIERVVVQAFFHGQHEIDNGQWKTLGLKIATDIAATAKIEDDETIRAICSVVDDEVYKILKQVKRELNKFLKKIGAQKIANDKAAA